MLPTSMVLVRFVHEAGQVQPFSYPPPSNSQWLYLGTDIVPHTVTFSKIYVVSFFFHSEKRIQFISWILWGFLNITGRSQYFAD